MGTGEKIEDPGFPSPFAEDDAPDATQDTDTTETDDWEPPSREDWEAAQRDLQTAQERERAAGQRAEQNQQLLAQLLQGSGSHGVAPPDGASRPPDPEPVDLSDMPDPVSDREGYARWLGRHLSSAEQRAAQRVEQTTQQLTAAQRADRLFDGFCTQYPAFRDKRDLVNAAAVQAGVTGHETEGVIYERTADVLKSWGVSLGGEDSAPRPTQTGVGPGSGESGRRRRRPAEPEPKDLVDELAENQVKLGIM